MGSTVFCAKSKSCAPVSPPPVTTTCTTGAFDGSYCSTKGGTTPRDFGTAAIANATCCCTRVCAELRSVPHRSHTYATESPFLEMLSMCETPGVALTYFSMRQVMVFSMSRAPRPGTWVPMTSTGGVSSGKVSTAMRGVTTPANTTSAMQIISTAMGLRSESAVIGPAPGPSGPRA